MTICENIHNIWEHLCKSIWVILKSMKISVKAEQIYVNTNLMQIYENTFKIAMNKSVLQYANELRVFEACKLMQNQQYTISYLSSLAGFNNLSYFNRTFLKVTGMTPRQYRKVFCSWILCLQRSWLCSCQHRPAGFCHPWKRLWCLRKSGQRTGLDFR